MYVLGLPNLLGAHGQLAFFLIALPPTLVISYVSYLLLETRTTNWMRGLRKPAVTAPDSAE